MSEANESKFSGAYIGLAPYIVIQFLETKKLQYGTTRALGNKSGGFCEAVNCEQSEQEGKFLFAYLMAPF